MSTELVRSDAFRVLGRLEDGGAVTSVSLDLSSRPDLTLEQFQAIGVFLDRLHDGTKFWIADLILEAEARFGEEAAQLVAALGRSERTLLNWVWVARAVPRSRRRENLTFTHHAVVAPLELPEQSAWLELAEAERWSSRELQAALRARRELGEGQRDECGDAVEEAARDLRGRLRVCGLDETRILIEVSGAGFSYEVRVP